MVEAIQDHYLDIGEKPWPDIAIVNGVVYRVEYRTISTSKESHEKMKHIFPNFADFVFWTEEVTRSLVPIFHFIMRYVSDEGVVLNMTRYPPWNKTEKCGCGKMIHGQEPSPEEKAKGVKAVFRCYKCNTETHTMEKDWRKKQWRKTQ